MSSSVVADRTSRHPGDSNPEPVPRARPDHREVRRMKVPQHVQLLGDQLQAERSAAQQEFGRAGLIQPPGGRGPGQVRLRELEHSSLL